MLIFCQQDPTAVDMFGAQWRQADHEPFESGGTNVPTGSLFSHSYPVFDFKDWAAGTP